MLEDNSHLWKTNDNIEIRDIQTPDINTDILDVSDVQKEYQAAAYRSLQMVLEVAKSHPNYHWSCAYKDGTLALSREIHRILKPGGLFIGSVNSSIAYEIVKAKAKVLADNYYLIGERHIRLFDRPQFERFFEQFETLSLEEIHTVRFKNRRDHWEFIFQKD